MARFSALTALIPAGAGAASTQPCRQSMAQCVGPYEGVCKVVNEPKNRDRFGAEWAEWATYGGLAAFSEGFGAWTGYCRPVANDTVANDQGIAWTID